MFRRIFLIYLVLVIALIACQRGIIYTNTEPIDSEGWKSEDFVSFDIVVDDTTRVHNLDLHIRNDGRYEYSNLFLFIKTYAPTGATIKDTIECMLADKSGKWLGNGIGGQYNRTIPYKRQVVFPYKGKYRIEIEHGMREDPLLYIKDLGLTIKVEK
jgi:gliding motility-associated lipoprotein GldH